MQSAWWVLRNHPISKCVIQFSLEVMSLMNKVTKSCTLPMSRAKRHRRSHDDTSPIVFPHSAVLCPPSKKNAYCTLHREEWPPGYQTFKLSIIKYSKYITPSGRGSPALALSCDPGFLLLVVAIAFPRTSRMLWGSFLNSSTDQRNRVCKKSIFVLYEVPLINRSGFVMRIVGLVSRSHAMWQLPLLLVTSYFCSCGHTTRKGLNRHVVWLTYDGY